MSEQSHFSPCPVCGKGELIVKTGFAASTQEPLTPITEWDDGWKSATLKVRPTLVAECTRQPECTLTPTAVVGYDEDDNPVAPQVGLQISKILTDPDLFVLSDEDVAAMLRDR